MKDNLLRTAFIAFLILVYSVVKPDLQGFQPLEERTVRIDPPFLRTGGDWADSVMNTLSLEERIAQMIMVYGYSNMGPAHEKEVLKEVKRQKVGGVLFFQGEPLEQARLTNLYQEAAEVPLLIAMDGENGLGMRLQNTITYPATMILGSITDNSLIYRLGSDMAAQFKRLGVHLNLAPVADINNNPLNPVIGTRSFGEERNNVAAKVVALMEGMQDHNLLVAAKHFPGHGDTGTDSHYTLPLVPYDRTRLDSLELYPFAEAISNGLTGMMVAHLRVPALDPRENRATTMSRPAITGVLKEEMGFKGLIITDALNMKGLSSYNVPGSREVEAVRAGNDVLLMPADVDEAIDAIKKAVRQGDISEASINNSCRKILQAKYWTGAFRREPIRIGSLLEDLNRPGYQVLYRELVEHSLILAKNRDGTVPIKDLERITLATVTISREEMKKPLHTTDLYLEGDHYTMASDADLSTQMELIRKLADYNTVIVNVLNTSSRASHNYGITYATVHFLELMNPASRHKIQENVIFP